MERNRLARVGGWCFRHSWAVLGIWLVLVTVGGLSAGPVFDGIVMSAADKSMESAVGEQLLEAADGATAIGFVDHVDAHSPAVASVLSRAGTDIKKLPKVAMVDTPKASGTGDEQQAPSLIAGNGSAAMIVVKFQPMTDEEEQEAALAPVRERLQRVPQELAATGVSGARMRVGGELPMALEEESAEENDLTRSELIALPLTMFALIFIFGGLVAAGLPVLAAGVSIVAAMTLLLGFATFTQLDQNTVTILTLLGLGLAIDYGLLLVGRYREELAGGLPADRAIRRAWATAGRTIMFSALTVALSISAMLVFDLASMRALGTAGVSIAIVAMVTALTFTAAMIGLTKRWIRPSRRQVTQGPAGPAAGSRDESGCFAAIARLVQRRPVLATVVTAMALLGMASPLLSAVLRQPAAALPAGYGTTQVAADYARSFGPEPATVTVLASTTPTKLDAWAGRWRTDRAIASVLPAEPIGATRSAVTLNLRGDAQDDGARKLVGRIRADRPSGGSSWVTGSAADMIDEERQITNRLPFAIGVMATGMLVLLFLMTGSLIVPIKAMLANVISIGAAFGVFTLVFQKGYGRSLLDTVPTDGLDLGALVIVFAFAFGLSMDYEVFLLGRIKEYIDHGLDNDTAVRRGLASTGRIITAAAALMVIVFGCFGSATTVYIEQIGIGLAIAILIDATLVRCLLVPATMTLLGRWNWWAPPPLRRLHARVGLTETPCAAAAGLAESSYAPPPLVLAQSDGGSPVL